LEVKDDNIITIIQNDLILKQGKIKFGFYEDSSHKEHYWHLGYYIVWADGSIQTLADALQGFGNKSLGMVNRGGERK